MPSFASPSKNERLTTTLPFAATSYVLVSVHPFVLRAVHLPSSFVSRAKRAFASAAVTARSAPLAVAARMIHKMRATIVRILHLHMLSDVTDENGCATFSPRLRTH